MRHNNTPSIHTSTSSPSTRAIAADANSVFDRIVAQLDALHERILKLECERSTEQQITDFCRRRSSWTVRQLATDLSMNEQTIRNYLALPDGHSGKLDSFQSSPGAPYRILPEHVADWIARGMGNVPAAKAA